MAILDLTTLARLTDYGQIKTDRADTSAVLSAMITSVSQRMAQYCSREFLTQAFLERRILRSDLFPVQNPTVQAISSVRVSTSGRAADLRPWSDYEIAPSGNAVSIWGINSGALVEVAYIGGIASDTTEVIADHPGLEDACKMQVVSLWKRHTIPDRSGMTLGTGDTQWSADYGLLKDVKAALDQTYNMAHRFV
jgi:hypothetical protein